jgi:hypothetical protein
MLKVEITLNLLLIGVLVLAGFFYFRHYESTQYGTQDSCVAVARAGAQSAPEVLAELGKRYGSAAVAFLLQQAFDQDNALLKKSVEIALLAKTDGKPQWACALGLLDIDLNVTGKHEEIVLAMARVLGLQREISIVNECNAPIDVNVIYYDNNSGWLKAKELGIPPRTTRATENTADKDEFYVYAVDGVNGGVWGRPAGHGDRDDYFSNDKSESGESGRKELVGFTRAVSEVVSDHFAIRFSCR